jgi:3-hydroxybutyryl-CoA dehydrogenase
MTDQLKVVVIGAGRMGSQIGIEYALGSHEVVFLVRDLAGSRDRVLEALRLATHAGIASVEEAADAAERVALVESVELLDPTTALVIESIPEERELKRTVLTAVAGALPAAIIASNTSSVQITVLGEMIGAPERIIGTHYWNPPLLMPPVEVVPGARTRPEIVNQVCELLVALGKEAILVESDLPGFIWNRLQNALLREALWLVENGVAPPRTIDQVVKSGLARRLRFAGPFETVALGGLYTWTEMAENLFPLLSNATRPGNMERWLVQSEEEIHAAKVSRDRGLVEELVRSRR